MKGGNIEIAVLRKMYLHGYGQKTHLMDNLQKSFPKHKRGNVDKTVKRLIKKNCIIVKSTGYGQHCSLNTQKIHEIML